MCTAMVPADMGEAFVMLESLMGFLADADVAELPVAVMAEGLRSLERVDAVEAVARARLLAVFSKPDEPTRPAPPDHSRRSPPLPEPVTHPLIVTRERYCFLPMSTRCPGQGVSRMSLDRGREE